jgi:hypothetical protein
MEGLFNEVQGVRNCDHTSVKSEYDAFRLFFDDEVMNYILSQTHTHYHKEFEKEVYFFCTE